METPKKEEEEEAAAPSVTWSWEKKIPSSNSLGVSLHPLSPSFSYFHLLLFAAQISDRRFCLPGESERELSLHLSLSLVIPPPSALPPPPHPSLPVSPWDLGLSPPVRCPSLSLTPAPSPSNCQMKFWVNFKCLKRRWLWEKVHFHRLAWANQFHVDLSHAQVQDTTFCPFCFNTDFSSLTLTRGSAPSRKITDTLCV